METVPPHIINMQILIKGLRSAEAGSITQSEVQVLRGVEAQISARTHNGIIHQVMLVDTSPNQYSPLGRFPFILQKNTGYVDGLFRVPVVAHRTNLKHKIAFG